MGVQQMLIVISVASKDGLTLASDDQEVDRTRVSFRVRGESSG